jgi:DNA-3-methyladenine glycosylase
MMGRRTGRRLNDLANGPGKLTTALDIRRGYNGSDFFGGGNLWIGEALRPVAGIVVSRRIGISKAIDEPLRFHEEGNPFVSGPKRGNFSTITAGD